MIEESDAARPQVFIIDDDDAVRDAMGMLCESADLAYAAYASGIAFLEHYHADMAGCLVLDIRMPGMSGLELQQHLIDRHSLLPIIFITGHGDLPMAVEAMRRGAADFMRKPVKEDDLLQRIHSVVQDAAQSRARVSGRQRMRRRLELLSEREREVFTGVTDGVSNKVIASELGISQRTVEVHRANLMEKLGAGSLAQLVRIRIENES
jgi:FixJ family two-component response regulator